jgi:hypothetical protein
MDAATQLREILAPFDRIRLAISGEHIMRVLECGPGPHVGNAIRFLEREVSADPTLNTQNALLRTLDRWRDAR